MVCGLCHNGPWSDCFCLSVLSQSQLLDLLSFGCERKVVAECINTVAIDREYLTGASAYVCSAQAELRSAQASRGPESMSHEASTSGRETSSNRARAGRKRSTAPQRAGTQTHLHDLGNGQKTGDSEISVSEGQSSKRIRTNSDES